MFNKNFFLVLLFSVKLFAPETTTPEQPERSLFDVNRDFCIQKAEEIFFKNKRKALGFAFCILDKLGLYEDARLCDGCIGKSYLSYCLKENRSYNFLLLEFFPNFVECSELLKEDYKLPEVEVYLTKDRFTKNELEEKGFVVDSVEVGSQKVACWQIKNIEELMTNRLSESE